MVFCLILMWIIIIECKRITQTMCCLLQIYAVQYINHDSQSDQVIPHMHHNQACTIWGRGWIEVTHIFSDWMLLVISLVWVIQSAQIDFNWVSSSFEIWPQRALVPSSFKLKNKKIHSTHDHVVSPLLFPLMNIYAQEIFGQLIADLSNEIRYLL